MASNKSSGAKKYSTSNNSANKSKKGKNSKNKINSFLAVILAIIAIYISGLAVENDIDKALGLVTIERYTSGDVVDAGELKIHFIDVGQGDACLIELPDNKVVMIDAGDDDPAAKTSIFTYIDYVNNVREVENRPKIEYLDYFILTHSDEDHMGWAPEVFAAYPAKVFYRPNQRVAYAGNNSEVKDFTDPALNGANPRNRFWGEGNVKDRTTLIYARTIKAGYAPNFSFTPEGIVTNPADSTQNTIKPSVPSSHKDYYEINFYGHTEAHYSNHNNYSPIILIEFDERKIALSGDCEKMGEEGFVSKIGTDDRYNKFLDESFSVDIIKLGHHGSVTSSTTDYLEAMTANRKNVYAVISCGAGNSYGHPHQEVLDRIKSMGFLDQNILRTDEIDSTLEVRGIEFGIAFNQDGKGNIILGGQVVSFETRTTYNYNVAGFDLRFRYLGAVAAATLCLVVIIAYICVNTSNSKNK